MSVYCGLETKCELNNTTHMQNLESHLIFLALVISQLGYWRPLLREKPDKLTKNKMFKKRQRTNSFLKKLRNYLGFNCFKALRIKHDLYGNLKEWVLLSIIKRKKKKKLWIGLCYTILKYIKDSYEEGSLSCTVCPCRVRQEVVGLNQPWENWRLASRKNFLAVSLVSKKHWEICLWGAIKGNWRYIWEEPAKYPWTSLRAGEWTGWYLNIPDSVTAPIASPKGGSN